MDQMITAITRADLDAIVTKEALRNAAESIELLDQTPAAALSMVSIVLGLFDPQDRADARSAEQLVARFWGDAPGARTFEGYSEVDCETPALFALEAICHFSLEGLSSSAAIAYANRVADLFLAEFPEHEGSEV